MSLTKKKTARLWLRLMELALLVYTGWRTIDLLGLTLPEGSLIVAGLALVAIDFAFPAWRYYYNHGANSSMQRAIALSMCCVTFLGILLILAGDNLYHFNNRAGLSESLFTNIAIWASIIVILADLAALAALDMSEPERQRALIAEDAQEEAAAAGYYQLAQPPQPAPQITVYQPNHPNPGYAAEPSQLPEAGPERVTPLYSEQSQAQMTLSKPDKTRTKKRTCAGPDCSEKFVPTRADHVYHSEACRKKAARLPA